jgi:RNA polymerase sigma factor (sigma-70 family)
MTERELIERCINKDRQAQKYLFEKYSTLFLGICIRYVKNRDEAEDVLQEGFIKIFRNIKEYKAFGSFEGWMKKIIINTSITHINRNLKHQYHSDIDDIKEISVEEEYFEECDFTGEELLNVIQSLSDGYKTVFNLYAIEGYKHKEIAEMLNIDVNTSKSQYSRAKKIIQNKLEELKEIKYDKTKKEY